MRQDFKSFFIILKHVFVFLSVTVFHPAKKKELWPKKSQTLFFFPRKADKLDKILANIHIIFPVENHHIFTSLFILVLMRTQVITGKPTLEVHSMVHTTPEPMRQKFSGNG